MARVTFNGVEYDTNKGILIGSRCVTEGALALFEELYEHENSEYFLYCCVDNICDVDKYLDPTNYGTIELVIPFPEDEKCGYANIPDYWLNYLNMVE